METNEIRSVPYSMLVKNPVERLTRNSWSNAKQKITTREKPPQKRKARHQIEYL